MANGRKTGGRTKGTRNKRTEATVSNAEASGLMPLDFMLDMLRNSEDDADRKWAAKEAAPYLHARLASVDVGNKGGEALVVNLVNF
jgi:hypothetical protein